MTPQHLTHEHTPKSTSISAKASKRTLLVEHLPRWTITIRIQPIRRKGTICLRPPYKTQGQKQGRPQPPPRDRITISNHPHRHRQAPATKLLHSKCSNSQELGKRLRLSSTYAASSNHKKLSLECWCYNSTLSSIRRRFPPRFKTKTCYSNNRRLVPATSSKVCKEQVATRYRASWDLVPLVWHTRRQTGWEAWKWPSKWKSKIRRARYSSLSTSSCESSSITRESSKFMTSLTRRSHRSKISSWWTWRAKI